MGGLITVYAVIPFAGIMHLSMFSPGGGGGERDYPMELDKFEKLGSNSLPIYVIQCCVKTPLGLPSDLDIIS